eukprot:TRINITY_DN1951_c0_g1_i1.p1 TRINITY_DN1951_c0_g1~~TRINITY_DN1951_c0_g1_i1.p1  ORF type:complete len:418 (+),score=52.36 TRINITY_DN1951_c0_g1_i1:70-1323(+)
MISLCHSVALKAAAMVLLLAHGAAAEKFKSGHEHFHEKIKHQVKHGDISGLEKTVLAFAKVGKATPGMEVFLLQILNVVSGMKNDLVVQRNTAQRALNISWEEFLMCNYTREGDSDYDIPTKNNSHRTCSESESATEQAWRLCVSTTADLNTTAEAACALVDIRCQPQPVSCLDSPVQSGSVFPFLKAKFEEFNNSYWACKNVEDVCIENRDRANQTLQNCSELYRQWQGLVTECNEKQGGLERAACGDLQNFANSTCHEYQTCYITRRAIMEERNRSAEALYNDNEPSYRGLLRIECYLSAFNTSINGGIDLADGIETCRNTRYYGCQFVGPICPNYPPFPPHNVVPDMINCTYSPYSIGATLQPGTDAWIQKYYANMPANTTYEACNATCCGACSALCPSTAPSTNNHGVAMFPR